MKVLKSMVIGHTLELAPHPPRFIDCLKYENENMEMLNMPFDLRPSTYCTIGQQWTIEKERGYQWTGGMEPSMGTEFTFLNKNRDSTVPFGSQEFI